MSLNILQGKSWWEISRDERYFCAELFRSASVDISKFVRAIACHSKITMAENENWEMAVEVCFYRDFSRVVDISEIEGGFSQKRTFDICLFSETQVIIIEAKANQSMPPLEASQAREDKVSVKEIFRKGADRDVDVVLLALVSSRYKQGHDKNSMLRPLEAFDGVVTWKELETVYGNRIFERADSLYREGSKDAL